MVWKMKGVLTSHPSSHWNYRLVKFKNWMASDEGAFDVRIVEVYYENDIPHSYCEPHAVAIEDLELPEDYTDEIIKSMYALALVNQQSKVAGALHEPILDGIIFEGSEK